MMAELSKKSKIANEEREKSRIIVQRKKAHVEMMRKRRMEAAADEDAISPEPAGTLELGKIIFDLQRVQQEIETVELPKSEEPETDSSFISSLQVFLMC